MTKREGRWDCQCGAQVLGRHKKCPSCSRDRGLSRVYLPENAPAVTDPKLLELASHGPDWLCEHCQTNNMGSAVSCSTCGAPKGSSPSTPVRDYALSDVPHTAEEANESAAEPPSNSQDWSPPSTTTIFGYEPIPERRSPSTSTIFGSEPIPDRWVREKQKSKPKNDYSWTRTYAPSVDRRQLAYVLTMILVVGAIAGFIYLLLRPYEVQTTVQTFEWSRTIYIDQYRTVQEGAWSLPAAGRLQYTEQRIHHYVQVFDHYETDTEKYQCGSKSVVVGQRDTGDGFFEDIERDEPIYCEREVKRAVYRDEPVYATWYVYDIDKWLPSRNVPTQGRNRSDPLPFWGEFTLACANTAQIGCERESGRSEDYVIVFTWQNDDKPETYRHSFPRADWDAYEFGTVYKLVLNGVGQLLNDPLRPDQEEEK